MAAAATRKTAAKTHPAANRRPLRYEHPFSTHWRCMAGTDGSATGRGKSGSSEATSTAGAARAAKSFMLFDVVGARTKLANLSDIEESKADATLSGTRRTRSEGRITNVTASETFACGKVLRH
jgi:hypothetical protein